jgi:hypothetical protein
MTIPTLQFDRKVTMFGICDRINALVDHEPFARAIRDAVYDRTWEVVIFHVDGTVSEHTVTLTDDDAADIAQVEAIIFLSFRSNFAPKGPPHNEHEWTRHYFLEGVALSRASLATASLAPVKVPARNLLTGDQVGSGETVKWVGVGVRTPRGKVEIQLEKDGRTRLAIWGASTLINVRRAA